MDWAIALAIAASGVAGQVPPSPQPAPPAAAAAEGVTSYPASFFAAAQPSTARDMIDRLPGFVFDPGDSSIRGLAGAAGNVLIDGQRPVSKSDDLGSIIYRIPASQVERIDVIRGGAPGIDMQGKTVLANIIRKKAAAVTGVVAVADQYVFRDGRQAPAVRVEGTRRQNGTLLEASAVIGGFIDDGFGDGFRVQRDPSGAPLLNAADHTQGGGTQAVATGAYERPLFGGRFRINGQYLHQRYRADETVEPYGAPSPLSIERDRQDKDQGELGLHYNRDFGAHTKLEALFIQQLHDQTDGSRFSTASELDDFLLHRKAGESVGRATLTYDYAPNLSFETGGEGAFNWLDSHTVFTVNGSPIALPAANVRVSEKRGEAFGSATWKASPQLTVEAGIRIEGSTIASTGDVVLSKTLIYPKPRLFVTWAPTPVDQVRLRLEREVGQLDFGAFAASSALSASGQVRAGNPNLNPEQAWVAEAAYERHFWKNGATVITVRHSQLKDVVDRIPIFAPSGAFDAPGNIGTGRKDEVIVSLNLPLDNFGIKGGLFRIQETHRWSEVTDPVTGRRRSISGLHGSDGEAHFSQDLPKWKLKWGVDVSQGWIERYYRLSEIEADKLRTFVTLYADYRPMPGLVLSAQVQNITARGFERFLDEYAGPRNQSPLAYRETRDLQMGPMLYLRARQSF